MNNSQKLGIGIGTLGALWFVFVSILVYFIDKNEPADLYVVGVMISTVIIAIGYLIYTVGERKNWTEIARHREYVFVQHKITKKRRWLYSGGSRLTEEEKRWLNGETDDL